MHRRSNAVSHQRFPDPSATRSTSSAAPSVAQRGDTRTTPIEMGIEPHPLQLSGTLQLADRIHLRVERRATRIVDDGAGRPRGSVLSGRRHTRRRGRTRELLTPGAQEQTAAHTHSSAISSPVSQQRRWREPEMPQNVYGQFGSGRSSRHVRAWGSAMQAAEPPASSVLDCRSLPWRGGPSRRGSRRCRPCYVVFEA